MWLVVSKIVNIFSTLLAITMITMRIKCGFIGKVIPKKGCFNFPFFRQGTNRLKHLTSFRSNFTRSYISHFHSIGIIKPGSILLSAKRKRRFFLLAYTRCRVPTGKENICFYFSFCSSNYDPIRSALNAKVNAAHATNRWIEKSTEFW